MATITFRKLNKVYPGGVRAVKNFSLEVKDREFIVLVGPSGCGKSTTLRMVAGLEEISHGELYIDDLLVNDVAPKDRDIAMVFQSYALYPHMSVYDNMAFGLKIRKMPKNEIDKKVKEAAEILGLLPYLDRKPRALSGGQRQRVALGRAIVRDAKVFLMDEPLSNLDAKLRVQTRGELIKLHDRLKTTTLYVTHDQIEAMTMANRIVVQNDGVIQQVGTPKEIYDTPVNIFVGGFIGTPPMNFIEGIVEPDGVFVSGDYKFKLPEEKLKVIKQNRFFKKPVVMGIRPEDIYDDLADVNLKNKETVKLIVDVAELLGSETNIYTDVNGYQICASVSARDDLRLGDEVVLELDMDKTHFFDAKTEFRLVYDYNLPPEGVENPQIIPSDYQGLGLDEGLEYEEEEKVGFLDKIKGLFKRLFKRGRADEDYEQYLKETEEAKEEPKKEEPKKEAVKAEPKKAAPKAVPKAAPKKAAAPKKETPKK